MKITLKKIDRLCGPKCFFYQVQIDDEFLLYDEFLKDHDAEFHKEILQIAKKMKAMSRIGAKDNLLKIHEGAYGDGVCAIHDKKCVLRLYCIRYEESVIVLGYGGEKPDGKAYQTHPELNTAAYTIRNVSKIIQDARRGKYPQIWLKPNGDFGGNLTIETDDYEQG